MLKRFSDKNVSIWHRQFLYKKSLQKQTELRTVGEAAEMTQQLKALAALPEIPSSSPSIHMAAHNHG